MLDADAEPPAGKDRVLPRLRAEALALDEVTAAYLERRYVEIVARAIPDVSTPFASPRALLTVIRLHRRMLCSEEYIASRIANPTTGTLDHVHAELTAHLAADLGAEAGLDSNTLELLRVAGHVHDADRSFPRLMTSGELETRSNSGAYQSFKVRHMLNAGARARDLCALARNAGEHLSPEIEEDLVVIVENHEFTPSAGDPRTLRASCLGPSLERLTELVRDADSLSFFDTNILTHWAETGRNHEQFVAKLRYSFSRLGASARRRVLDEIIGSETHPLGERLARGSAELQTIRDLVIRAAA